MALTPELLTLDQALEHPIAKAGDDAEREAWQKRRDKRQRPFSRRADVHLTLLKKRNPNIPIDDLEAVSEKRSAKALAAEIEANDQEPGQGAWLWKKKLCGGALQFYRIDAMGNRVRGNAADLATTTLALTRDAIRRGKQGQLLIDTNDLKRAGQPEKQRGTRGPEPKTRDRVVREMKDDIRAGHWTIDGFKKEKQEVLIKRYKCSTQVVREARSIVLSEFKTPTNSDTK